MHLNIKLHTYIFHLFTVPSPVVEVTSIGDVEFGEAATLECKVITVRGISSRANIIWRETLNYTILRRVENVTASIVNNSAVYTDQLVTPPLSINDSGRGYSCEFFNNQTYGANYIALNFIGK